MNTPAEIPEGPPSRAPLAEAHTTQVTDPPSTVSMVTLLRFLNGDRQAILDIANSQRTILLGGILVLSAGLAREYDGEDLLREPWHLFIPHAASLVTSFVLYCMVRLVAVRRKAGLPGFIPGFGIFLGLFWLTAPLAWVYAVPFERWAGPADATRLNLMLLGLVSLWRVVLIIRVIQVAFGGKSTLHITMTVLLFGDGVMLTAISFVPVPIIQIMGGIRLTETEAVLQTTVVLLQLIGILALPVLIIGYALAMRSTPEWGPAAPEPSGKFSSSAWIVAALTILVWGAVLPFTQPEQQRRGQVERDLKSGRITEALRLMSMHQRSDFPPLWDPPPHVALVQHSPHIADVVSAVLTDNPADWIREIYLEKFKRKFAEEFSPYSDPTEQEMERYLTVLEGLPLEHWYPKDDWEAEQFRTTLDSLLNDDQPKIGPTLRKHVQRALERLPEKDAPESLQFESASP